MGIEFNILIINMDDVNWSSIFKNSYTEEEQQIKVSQTIWDELNLAATSNSKVIINDTISLEIKTSTGVHTAV